MMSIHSNIRKLYLLEALSGVVFYYALDKIFMGERGLDVAEIVTLEVIAGIVIIFLEVPSGALSDRWSRKKVLMLSGFFFVLNTAVWALSTNFALFALGVAFGSVSIVLNSGTNTSMLYDSLKQIGKEKEYEKYLGRKRAIGAIAFMVAAPFGGLIADKLDIEATLWWSLPSAILAVVVAGMLVEPTFHRSTGEVSYWKHIRQTGSFLREKPFFIHVMMLASVTSVVFTVGAEYGQIYLALVGLGVFALGALASLGGLIEAVLNTAAEYIGRAIPHHVVHACILVLMSISLVAIWVAQSWIGVVGLFASSGLFFVTDVVLMADFNRKLPSKIRATSESFVSLISTMLYVVVVACFAYISQKYNIATGFGVLGGLVSAYTVYYIFFSAGVIKRKLN